MQTYSATGWTCNLQLDRRLAADCRSNVRLFGQCMAANCAALPTANAGQYTTSHCKWQYINVQTFNLYYYYYY